MQVAAKDQLLLYIKSEGSISKSRVKQALEMRFTFPGK